MAASASKSPKSHQHQNRTEKIAANSTNSEQKMSIRQDNSATGASHTFQLHHKADSMLQSHYDEQLNDSRNFEEIYDDMEEEPLVIASEEIQPVKVAESGKEVFNLPPGHQDDITSKNSPSKSSQEDDRGNGNMMGEEDRSQAKRQLLVEDSSILAFVEKFNELLAAGDSTSISAMDTCNLIYECDICKKLSRGIDEFLNHRQELCQSPIQRCTPYQHQHQLNQHNRLAVALKEISRSTAELNNAPPRMPKFASSDLFKYQPSDLGGRRRQRLVKNSRDGAMPTGGITGPVTIIKRPGISKNDPRRKYPCYLCSKKLVHLKDVARHVIMKHKVPKRHDWEELVMKKMAAEMHGSYIAE